MNDTKAKRDRSSRSRYLEDDGIDTVYDGASSYKSISNDLKSTCALGRNLLRGVCEFEPKPAWHLTSARAMLRVAHRSKTYHSAMRSTTPKTMTSLAKGSGPDGMIYNPKQTLLSGRRHAPVRDSTTKGVDTLHVSEPKRLSFQFDKSLKRFEVCAS